MANTSSKQKSSGSKKQNNSTSKFTWHADDIVFEDEPQKKQKSKSPKKSKK